MHRNWNLSNAGLRIRRAAKPKGFGANRPHSNLPAKASVLRPCAEVRRLLQPAFAFRFEPNRPWQRNPVRRTADRACVLKASQSFSKLLKEDASASGPSHRRPFLARGFLLKPPLKPPAALRRRDALGEPSAKASKLRTAHVFLLTIDVLVS